MSTHLSEFVLQMCLCRKPVSSERLYNLLENIWPIMNTFRWQKGETLSSLSLEMGAMIVNRFLVTVHGSVDLFDSCEGATPSSVLRPRNFKSCHDFKCCEHFKELSVQRPLQY